MTLAPWRSPLARALHRNRSLVYSRYLQLATVRVDGRPANRTVVFRGFLNDSNKLKFVTDNRSEKVDQIAHHPWGECCWYFPKTREQFRLFGQLHVISAQCSDCVLQKCRQIAWQELSASAQSQFYWPEPRQPKSDLSAFERVDEIPPNPPETFCLMVLEPEQVEHLELRGEPQNRTIYDLNLEKNWLIETVNP